MQVQNIPLAVVMALVSARTCQGQGCFVDGECASTVIYYEGPAEDAQNCLDICQDQYGADCGAFTYYDDTGTCLAVGSCGTFTDVTCNRCVSGESTCEDLQCWEQGSCVGGEVTTTVYAISGDACQGFCPTYSCDWFTFDEATGDCQMIRGDCLALDSSCTSCISGQGSCYRLLKTQRASKLMVIGGNTPDGSGGQQYTNSVELLDMEAITSCYLPDYPFEGGYMQAGFLDGSYVKSCGGEGDGDHEECYDYDVVTQTWSPAQSLSQSRVGGGASHLEGGLWMVFGGSDDDNTGSDVWDGATFLPGPILVDAVLFDQCQVGIDPTHVFLTDGDDGSTWILDYETYEFETQPPMTPKSKPGCGRIINADGGIEVVVTSEGVTEIFDVESKTWRTGPELPIFANGFGHAQIGDTFVLVGGEDESGINSVFQDSVFIFDPIHYQWVRQTVRLRTPRANFVVVAVPADVTCP